MRDPVPHPEDTLEPEEDRVHEAGSGPGRAAPAGPLHDDDAPFFQGVEASRVQELRALLPGVSKRSWKAI